MTAKRKARCFVAMAFDHDDTDALYEKAIEPILKSNGVIPILINRRQDNRDINNQIIEQLNTCDFCICDLTYTRPSVYFEAGYAQRSVEVIYLVRYDHLLKDQPDDRRVHFDLQMKPLIKWNDPTDATFPIRLEKRLRNTALKNWKATQARDEKLFLKREEFAQMPLKDRLFGIRRMAFSKLVALGFTKWMPLVIFNSHEKDFFSRVKILREFPNTPWLMSINRSNQILNVVSFLVLESLTLSTLRDEFKERFLKRWNVPHLDGNEMIKERRPINRTIEHHILISIRDIPQRRIMSALPTLRWESKNNRYSEEMQWSYTKTRWPSTHSGRKSIKVELFVQRAIHLHFISGILSFPEFKKRLEDILQQMAENQ